MRRLSSIMHLGITGLLVSLAFATLQAQTSPTAQVPAPPVVQAPAPQPRTSLRFEVVMSRYLREKKLGSTYVGEKELGSVPYTLMVLAGERTSFSVGVDVSAGESTSTSAQGVTTRSPNYRNVGTSIQCLTDPVSADGRYRVTLIINDSSIFTPDSKAVRSGPVVPATNLPLAFRSYSVNNALILRDGQTVQFSVGTDKISGETIKAEVTLTVVK